MTSFLQKEGMTMRRKWFIAGLLAAVGILAWGSSSQGGDTIRLNMVDHTPTKNLVEDGRGADTIRTWHHHFGWGWGGFYRPYYWGWGGFYRPYYWGWGGFYRPYYWGWGGFYRPYYWGWGWSGFYLPYYSFGFGYSGFFWPWCAGVSANVYTLHMPAVMPNAPLPSAPQSRDSSPDPQQPRKDSTFPYDGGPSNPVPSPKDVPPSSTTPHSVPMEGRAVSLPKAKSKWIYPAYGETARRITPASERTYLTRGQRK